MQVCEIESLLQTCKDDEDFHTFYVKAFAEPLLQLPNTAQEHQSESCEFCEDDIYPEKVHNNSLLSKEQIEAFKKLKVPAGVTWESIVRTLYNTARWINYRLQESIILPDKAVQPAEKGVSMLGLSENKHHLCASFARFDLIKDGCHSTFVPDIIDNPVTLSHINTAHQIELRYHELKQPSPNAESYSYDFMKNEPSTGMFVCLSEGLCVWNRAEQKYEVIFPMLALRFMSYQYQDRLLEELWTVEQELEKFFEQRLVLRYQVMNSIAKLTTCNLMGFIREHMSQFELDVVEASIIDSTFLHISCVRRPKWNDNLVFSYNLSSHYERYIDVKYKREDKEMIRRQLNYSRRPNLVITDDFVMKLPKEAIRLKRVSLQVVVPLYPCQ